MNRKYVWIGIVVLVCLCLFVSSVSAAKTTLKEDYVDLAQSYYTNFEIPEYCSPPGGNKEMIRMMVDYEKKGNEYTKYIIYNASIDNVVAYSSVPDVVTQSITINAGGHDNPEWVGTGTIKIYKLAYNDSGYVHADIVVELDIDQTWQNGISGDRTLDFADGNKEYTFSNLASFYDAGVYIWGASRSLGMDIAWDTTGAAEPYEICNELGLTLFATNQLVYGDISSAEGQHTIGILSNFYNAYEIYVEETYEGEPIKYVDITRDCDECELKNTRSKVVVLDEDGEVLLDSPFYQDTNTSHPFGSVGITVYLGAANMSEEGTSTEYVFLYSDTETEPPDICYVKGYTYDAETASPLSDVSVTLNGHSDTSDGDGVYFVGPIFTGKNYTLTATKSGYLDVVYPLYLAYGQDYLIDLPLIPVHPIHTEHGILGTVTTLPYYGICENHTVKIENTTWSDMTTTNSIGYYIFDNLEVDNYWINVSKDGYRDNNQIVTVSATGDEIETIDNCDATANWASDNSLTLNITDKQEGAGSLQSLCSNTLDFNKSAPSAVDASNTTKSNGYLVFWYKVNDTTRLNDYVIITVGSAGNNATNKISWSVYKDNFVNNTWVEVFLKFSDGTESGTLNMSNINWFELKASKSNCIITKIDDIRFYDFSYEIHDVHLDPILVLGVIAKTLDEHVIQTFTATLGNTILNTTSGEELIFTDLHYGMHELTVISEGYFPSQRSIYLDKDMNVTVYMTEEQQGGVGTQYAPPHLVRFFVQDIYANPKQNVEVTVTCIQTTMGSWDWLLSIFGYKNETQLQNTTMNGTTDSAGGISFLMIETIKYNLYFYNATQSIDETLTIYPKSDKYTVIVGRTGFFDVEPQLFGDEIDWNFTMERINTTAAWLNFTYNDTLDQTTSGSYHVYMVNETTGLEKINTSNVTYFCSTPVNIDSNVWSYNCIVYDYRGNTYILAFNATHTTAGEFKEAVSVFFRYNHPLIQFEGWDTGYYQFLSIALLIFLGMLFSGTTVKIGCVILPLAAWGLYGIGWFSPTSDLVTSAILLGIATAIGIGVYMTTTGREKNLAS